VFDGRGGGGVRGFGIWGGGIGVEGGRSGWVWRRGVWGVWYWGGGVEVEGGCYYYFDYFPKHFFQIYIYIYTYMSLSIFCFYLHFFYLYYILYFKINYYHLLVF
jgi:hypothetical protein